MTQDPEPAGPDGGLERTPRSGERSIFRSEALRHYTESQNRLVFPRFTTARALTYLWALAAFFIILGFALALGPFVAAGGP